MPYCSLSHIATRRVTERRLRLSNTQRTSVLKFWKYWELWIFPCSHVSTFFQNMGAPFLNRKWSDYSFKKRWSHMNLKNFVCRLFPLRQVCTRSVDAAWYYTNTWYIPDAILLPLFYVGSIRVHMNPFFWKNMERPFLSKLRVIITDNFHHIETEEFKVISKSSVYSINCASPQKIKGSPFLRFDNVLFLEAIFQTLQLRNQKNIGF